MILQNKKPASPSRFHDLNITCDDYSPSPKEKGYYRIHPAVHQDLTTIFLQKLQESVEIHNWKYSENQGKPVVTVIFNSTDKRPALNWEFTVEAGIPEQVNDTTLAEGVIPVKYHVCLHHSNETETWEKIADYEQSGPGEYDPCKWTQTVIEIIEGFCTTGEKPGMN